jgi:hypothetical protein
MQKPIEGREKTQQVQPIKRRKFRREKQTQILKNEKQKWNGLKVGRLG